MNEQKLSKLSSISEIISSIAIILTLIYLAIQTQQNTDAIQSSARQEAMNTELELLYKALDYPYAWTGPRLSSNPNYTDDQLLVIMVTNLAYFRIRENFWLQYDAGVLDSKIWNSYLIPLINDLNNDSLVRDCWDSLAATLDPGFVAEIDKSLNKKTTF